MRTATRTVGALLLLVMVALSSAPAATARPVAGFSIGDGRALGPIVAPVSRPPVVAEPAAAALPARTGRFRLNLARPNDFVAQTSYVQCVGASVQMMLNIERPGADHTAATQLRLQRIARARSGPAPAGFVRQGAGMFGWAAALSIEGDVGYRVVGADSLADAMRQAAIAIRISNRPVGLLVWRGRHAWVMSGFVATADPALTSDFRVTRAFILDPLFPLGSSAWGPSPRPGRAIAVRQVGRQFVRRRTSGPWSVLPGMARLAGKYVLVVPTAE